MSAASRTVSRLRQEQLPASQTISKSALSSQEFTVSTLNISDVKKGMKVQIEGDPYVVLEALFVKPGKGQAVYTLKMRHLLRNTVLERKYRSGDSIETADVTDFDVQYLYQQGTTFVFMDNSSYEQYEMEADQMDGADKYLKEGMACQMTLWNGNPISLAPPNHVELKVEYTEPAVRGNTATNLTKPCTTDTGAEIQVPAFVEIGDVVRVDTRTGEYIERVKS